MKSQNHSTKGDFALRWLPSPNLEQAHSAAPCTPPGMGANKEAGGHLKKTLKMELWAS